MKTASDPDMPSWFSALTDPRSVAVVGATDKRETFSGAVLTNLASHGFGGTIYPVNPHRESVGGLPAYPDLASLPEIPECVVVVVSADLAVAAVEQAASLGVPGGIVVASGFTEGGAGANGARRTERLRAALADASLRLLGPSTTGLISLRTGFVPRAALNQISAARVTDGPVSLLAQSGACSNIVYGMGQSLGLPVGLAVSTGLQLDLNVWDWFEAVLLEGRTETVLLLVEELGPAVRWVPLLKTAADRGVSVVLCRAGRTGIGAAAARTHTGAVAGDWAAEAALARAAGAVVVPALDDLWNVGTLCYRWGAPTRPYSRTLGVVSMSGGEGALLADGAGEFGLDLVPLTPAATAALAPLMPLGAPGNPLDPTGAVMGKAEATRALAEAFLDETDYAAHLFALPGLDMFLAREIAEGMLAGTAERPELVAVSGWWFDDRARSMLAATGLPVFDSSSIALRAIDLYLGGAAAAMVRPEGDASWQAHVDEVSIGNGNDYWETLGLAVGLGFRIPARRTVADTDEAVHAAAELGYPVVVKANTPSGVHKARAGLVRTGLRTVDEVAAAAAAIVDRWAGELVVEEHVLGDLEVLLGARRSDHTGMVAVFGSGGRMVELHRDVVVIPMDFGHHVHPDDLRRTRVGQALADSAPDVLAEITRALEALVEFVRAEGVAAVEINPALIQLDSGEVVALDLRVDVGVQRSETLSVGHRGGTTR